VLATSRLVALLVGIGGFAVLLFVAGLVWRRRAPVFLAVAISATEYGAFLGLGAPAVDRWSPLVAAALFLAAELAYRATERSQPAPERAVFLRSLLWLFASAAGAAAVGAGLLAAAAGATGGLGSEALGVAAAIAALATLVALVARTRDWT
jgi:hypothetical protein